MLKVSFDKAVQEMLNGETLLDLSASLLIEVWGDPLKARNSDRWITGIIVCRICNNRALYSWPSDIFDVTRMECEACGHKTCEPLADNLIVIVAEEN